MKISRRAFLTQSLFATCSLCLMPKGLKAASEEKYLKEAMHYQKAEGGLINCRLCPRNCVIAENLRGHCRVRENKKGKLYTVVFGRPCTYHTDPIEKKPLFHFLPGTNAFSIATASCNIECKFCQNWQISQTTPDEALSLDMPPARVVEMARGEKVPTIAYTYTEPVVFYEYMHETARLGKRKGLKSVMVTNGFIQKKPMQELVKQLAAVKVDLKGFTEKFYRETCDGALAPVLETLKLLKAEGIWHEVVVLLVPTLNDSEKEIAELCQWVKKELGPQVPVHFTRYHPTYKIKNIPPTPIATLEKAHGIGKKQGLQFVYVGNVAGHPLENTYCPKCGKMIINRISYHIDTACLKNGACKFCGCTIPGVWA